MKTYKHRIADEILKRKLLGKGAVLVQGPKWCGKTTTAKQIAKSLLDLGNTAELTNAIETLQILPMKLLEGDVPRLIDEWQTIPEIWDMVRSEVDKRGEMGQFVLTGSSVPVEEEKRRHSGNGRYGWIDMRPMSLWESGESTGEVSLSALFDGKTFDPFEFSMDLEKLAFLVCRGGWPQSTFMEGDVALDQARDYYETIYKVDIHRVDKVRRSSERTRLLLRSYARNTGSATSFSKMSADIKENDNASITYETISDYVDALKKLFVLEDMPAWNPNLRSKAAIQSSDTRYFVDPSIATSALSLGPKDLINDLRTFGLYFESMVVRDLRTYSDALSGDLYHYRDSSGLECDAVLHRRNGDYGLVEIKLGGKDNIEKGAETLKSLAAKIDTDKMKAPSFLMVLIGVGQYAYRRPDGVYVVPIGCLKD
ncbi:MAG: DUF4143 domain-containing protein [Bacteroidales bacterium]|nr:DUF4143 domain-containing protein [Bacteroidales bacterium]